MVQIINKSRIYWFKVFWEFRFIFSNQVSWFICKV